MKRISTLLAALVLVSLGSEIYGQIVVNPLLYPCGKYCHTSTIGPLQSRVTDLENQAATTADSVTDLDNRVNDIEVILSGMGAVGVDHFEFTLYIGQNRNYDNGEVIRWFIHSFTAVPGISGLTDQERINCPYDGMYAVHLTIHSAPDQSQCGEVKVNGALKGTVIAEGTATTSSQSSNLVLARCMAGQQIWVESCSSDGTGWSNNGAFKTLWTGVLLYRI